MPNIRHNLDSDLVLEQVQKSIAWLEKGLALAIAEAEVAQKQYQKAQLDGIAHLWGSAPSTAEQLTKCFQECVQLEREHYALVRVIELPQEGDRFILVYGDADDATVSNGTGPFATFERACQWYLRGGR